MGEVDETDSLTRAVAAAPAIDAPLRAVAAVVLARVDVGDIGRAETIAARFDANIVTPGDGTLIAQLASGDHATAAACALALHEAFPGIAVALAAGPSQAAAIARAAALLSGPPSEAIRIDDALADALDARFEVRGDPAARVLLGRRTSHEPQPLDVGNDDELELVRWNLRFRQTATEQAYGAWHVRKAVPFIRATYVAGLIVWLLILPAIALAAPAMLSRIAALVFLVASPVAAACLAITYAPRLIAWVLPTAALHNAIAGGLAVAMCWLVDMPQMSATSAMVALLFAMTVSRLRPALAIAATVPYVAFAQLLFIHGYHSGVIAARMLTIYSSDVWIVLGSGVLVCAAADRVSRESYRQERIIEKQRDIIDRLQRAELRRQVAERSRGLSEALSRLTDGQRRPGFVAGDIIEERYRVVRLLGAGGMGQVHEVERIADNHRLALKTLTGPAHREALARFAREAQLAAEIDHPNLVPVLDVDVTRSGILFLVMELVAGASLAAERSRYGDASWAVGVMRQIAAALEAMHGRGIVHRDLKPSNILVDGTWVRVADFGLASLVDGAPFAETREAAADSPDLTRTGAILGTPLYMAPELAGGARQAQPSADVFSFGALAYELLTGKLPHHSPPVVERLSGRALTPALSIAIVRPELPTPLCALIDRCLADAPEARPTAQTVRAVLDAVSMANGAEDC